MIRWPAILVLLTCLAPLEAGTLTLQPEAAQNPPRAFRRATVTIGNTTGQVVRAVSFRSHDGGPTMVVDAIIAPGRKLEVTAPLPTLKNVNQTYDVRLLASPDDAAPPGAPLATLQADVNWGAEEGTQFTNPAYQKVKYAEPQWPGEAKRNILLALALGCLAMAAVRLVRPGAWRMLALAAVVAGTTLAAVWVLEQVQTVTYQQSSVTVNGRVQPVLVVGALGTVQRTLKYGNTPIYLNQADMRDDTMIMHVDRDATVTMRPGEVRLFLVGRM